VKGIDCRTRSSGCVRARAGQEGLRLTVVAYTHLYRTEECHRDLNRSDLQVENRTGGSDGRSDGLRVIGEGERAEDRMRDAIDPK